MKLLTPEQIQACYDETWTNRHGERLHAFAQACAQTANMNLIDLLEEHQQRFDKLQGASDMDAEIICAVFDHAAGAQYDFDWTEADIGHMKQLIDKHTAGHVDRALADVQERMKTVPSDLEAMEALVPGTIEVAKMRALLQKCAVAMASQIRMRSNYPHLIQEARELLVPKHLIEAHDRLVDVCRQDDGQAYKEARKYLQMHDPIAATGI